MPHVFDTKKLKKLESSERYEAIRPKELLGKMGLKTGDTVLDLGVGTGFFAVPALEIIGEKGQFYGTDISKDMLAYAKERTANFSNVELILSNGIDIPVEKNSVDFAITAFVLHELPDKEKVLSQIRKVLKPGGKLCIVEWNFEDIEKGPPASDRISIENASKLLEKESFSVKMSKELRGRFYYIISEKE